MPEKPVRSGGTKERPLPRKVSLKFLADYLDLSAATISLVMNRSPVADAIPQETKERVFAAARKFNYRPSYLARSLRAQRTFSIGVIVPEVSEGYAAGVLSGIEECLLNEGYFYFVVGHHHKDDLIDEYPRLLLGRSVDGLIAVDTPWRHKALPVPVVKISGTPAKDGTSIVLDHAMAAELALRHLTSLGHKRIAFIKGQEFSSDTELRFDAIRAAAKLLAVTIYPSLTTQLVGDLPSPELGYEVTRALLARGERFSALFAFNDVSAIGAVRAVREHGLDVPHDVSVVGFDDIPNAAYQWPGLTTIRQPLRKMGWTAAERLLRRITRPDEGLKPDVVVIEPELVVRGSTAPAKVQ